MQLDRFELADIHHPSALARKLHGLLGPLTSAVPILDIARALDIADVRLDRFDGFEGMLLTDRVRSAGCILANISKGQRRARFTVAHELGHFLMERHQLSDTAGFRCATGDMRETREGRREQRQESQANRFAIELLAPAYLMASRLSDEPDLRDAQRLRDHLDVSLEACLRRMIECRSEALAAVWSHEGRVRYFVRGAAFPYVSCRRGDPVPTMSAACRAIARGAVGFTSFREAHAFAWTGRSDLDLHEQTRIANNGHAVTLLWAEMPDAEDDDDGGLAELGMPGFR